VYVSSTAPIPLNSTSPMPSDIRARYNARKRCVYTAVENAASEYACGAPVSSFASLGFGDNFLYQVQRAANLLNQLASQNLITPAIAQAGATPVSTSDAPQVTPLNPVNTNPVPKPKPPTQGPWDAPNWGNAATQWPGVCAPWQSILGWFQQNPLLAVGIGAAVLLSAGMMGTKAVKRRRAKR